MGHKEFAFGELPFLLSSNYKKCKKAINTTEKVILFGQFEADIKIKKHFLQPCSIEFRFANKQYGYEPLIDTHLRKIYGNPRYVTVDNLRVWKQKDFYILHGQRPEGYDWCVHVVEIFFKRPCIFLHNYSKFETIETLLKKIQVKWNIPNKFTLALTDAHFVAHTETENFEYSLLIYKNKVTLLSSKKTQLAPNVICTSPDWRTKGTYKNLDDLFGQIDSFFNWMEEYDLQLHDTTQKKESL